MDIYLIYHPDTFTGYVGLAQNGLDDRWKGHIQSARSGGSALLSKAIRKYGESAFEKHVIQECATRDELQDRENYWIHKLGTLDPLGWNMNAGTAKPTLLIANGESPVIPESHPPFRKKGASLYLGASGKNRSNEKTLGEAHALATLHGDHRSAAAVHYAIATILDGHDDMFEAGYMLMVYHCRYQHHYSGYPKRRWAADKATGLPDPMHKIARFAVKHKDAIEHLHDEYVVKGISPHGLTEHERDAQVLMFREAIRKYYFAKSA